MAVAEIVSCEWLHEKQKSRDSNMVVLDVSWSSKNNAADEFKQRHIPGSRFLDVMSGAHCDEFPRNIPDTDTFTAHARSAGVSSSSHVVVYSDSDQAGYLVAGRAWWTFKYFGHENVSVLDGGLHMWLKCGLPTTSDVTAVQAGDFTARPTQALRTELQHVIENVSTPTFTLVDSRKSELHHDNKIPNAVNVPAFTLLDETTGTMKTTEQLQQLLHAAGVDLTKPVVTHCNSGMSSCTLALAATRAGAKQVALFHGGYNQWKRNQKKI